MNLRVQVIFLIFTYHISKSLEFATAEFILEFLTTDFNFCKTPDGKLGKCVKITDCQSVMTYISKNKNTSITDKFQFLKAYICGSIEELPKMCCPTEPIVNHLQNYNNYIEPNSLYPTYNEVFHKNLQLLPHTCGINKHLNRITSKTKTALSNSVVKGTEANPHEFPWMALLFYSTDKNNVSLCVGTIINEKYILTAAYCITEKLTFVRVGAYNILSSQNGKTDENNAIKRFFPSEDVNIEKKIPHKEFRVSTKTNDIALLRLSKSLNIFSENVKAICLPLQNSPNTKMATNTAFFLTGWGLTKNNFNSKVLLVEEVSTIAQEKCAKQYEKLKQPLKISNKQFCFGRTKSGQGNPCNSDTGSPIQMLNGERYTQYGLVSVGSKNCGKKNIPTINTRIDQYINWILDNIEP